LHDDKRREKEVKEGGAKVKGRKKDPWPIIVTQDPDHQTAHQKIGVKKTETENLWG